MFAALSGLAVTLGVAAIWWPPLGIAAIALFIANAVFDDWASLRIAAPAHALSVLARVLASAQRVTLRGRWNDEVAADLAALGAIRKRSAWLTVRDPLGLADLVRGGLLARLLLFGAAMRVVDRERDRLRRVVLWLGEIDAAIIATVERAVADSGRALSPQVARKRTP